jgi:hypothetical protein
MGLSYIAKQTYFDQVSMEKVDETLFVAVDHTDDLVDYYIGFETTWMSYMSYGFQLQEANRHQY